MIEDDAEQHQEPLEDFSEDFEDLAEATVIPPRWVIRDLLPVGITFLASPPKAGKSTLTLAAACLVAEYVCRALPPFISRVESPGPVLIFSAEAMAGELKYMVETGLGVRLQSNAGILVARRPEEFRIDNDVGRARLLHWLNARHPKLVILDPLRNFHDEDENDAGRMLRMLAPLRRWAVDHDSSFVVVHHTKKLQEGQTQATANDMRGSSALFGIADGVLVATPRAKSGEIVMDAIFKRAKGWNLPMAIGSYDRVKDGGSEVMSDLDAKVISLLSSGACETLQSIAAQTGAKEPAVRDSLLKLVRNKKVKLGSNNEWQGV